MCERSSGRDEPWIYNDMNLMQMKSKCQGRKNVKVGGGIIFYGERKNALKCIHFQGLYEDINVKVVVL